MTPAEDQRRAIRIVVDLPTRVRSQVLSLDGRAGNISQSGILFVAPRLSEAPTKVDIEIDLPDAEAPITLAGEIRWSSAMTSSMAMAMSTVTRGLVGIRFTDIAMSVRRRLANFVMSRAMATPPLLG